MKRLSILVGSVALFLVPLPAAAQDKLVVSVWGGSWSDLVAEPSPRNSRPKPARRSSSSPAAPSTG